MTTLIRNTEITRPTITPLTSSVLDHATVEDNSKDWGLRNNSALWSSYNCLDLLVPTPICPDPLVDNGTFNKTFSTAPWIPAFEFAVHGGVQCKAVGLDKADQFSEIKRAFGLSEGKGVERALLANRFVARVAPAKTGLTLRDQGAWAAPLNLTAGAGVDLKSALALLEGYAASIYAGVPTIHMPRAAVSLLSGDRVVWRDGKAYTQSGAKVAVGGGYDDVAMLTSGLWTLYATGEVYVERAEEVEVQEYVVPGDGALAAGGLADNTVVSLVERQYRVAVDCFVAKATARVFTP